MDADPVARLGETPEQTEARLAKMQDAVKVLLECMGEDPQRQGLQRTPLRVAKALTFLTRGYECSKERIISDIIGHGIFDGEGHDDMIVVKDIEFHSLCEHHMLPFYGKVHIGYIPTEKIVGLSKFARIVEAFARRLQVQERLTTDIADCIMEVLKPSGCGVVVEAKHMCMVMRGAQNTSSCTTTSTMLGEFRENLRTREEFLALIHHRR
eukprot:m.146801 g.146801  ORF g.146801 m.146801 type:complete len:210 (-) comp16816_c0_seq1:2193-2822(-)